MVRVGMGRKQKRETEAHKCRKGRAQDSGGRKPLRAENRREPRRGEGRRRRKGAEEVPGSFIR